MREKELKKTLERDLKDLQKMEISLKNKVEEEENDLIKRLYRVELTTTQIDIMKTQYYLTFWKIF